MDGSGWWYRRHHWKIRQSANIKITHLFLETKFYSSISNTEIVTKRFNFFFWKMVHDALKKKVSRFWAQPGSLVVFLGLVEMNQIRFPFNAISSGNNNHGDKRCYTKISKRCMRSQRNTITKSGHSLRFRICKKRNCLKKNLHSV